MAGKDVGATVQKLRTLWVSIVLVDTVLVMAAWWLGPVKCSRSSVVRT